MSKKRNPNPKPDSMNGRRVNGSNVKRAEWTEQKQTEAAERQSYWDGVSLKDKVLDLRGRRGASRKQIDRIADQLYFEAEEKEERKAEEEKEESY